MAVNQADKFNVLHEYFGHHEFREGQENIIDSILSQRDTLGIMPTGAGKSMCYQIPALMFDGITVVVSPLISLMKDQVNSLIQSGVRAAYLNSSLSSVQYETAVSNAKKGMYKIIYVAPERLCTPSFLSLSRYVKISLLAVDEAHCVSQWGQDFRPSYMKIPEFLSQLGYRPALCAFTATATAQVRDDIIKMLNLENPYCLTTGFDRKNLYFGVSHTKDKYGYTKNFVGENKDKCGIIYCSTRKNVESVCEKLCDDGFLATRYHAGLSDEERRKNQDDFIYDRVSLIVATNAFGMGIDKSNVSYVIHYNMPKNIEAYYQEAGRAGRDGNDAKCVLLYSGQDVSTNRFLIDNSNDNSELDEEERQLVRARDLKRLKAMTDYCNTSRCLREYILSYFGEAEISPCGNCSNCSTEFVEEDVTLQAQKVISCIYRLLQRNLHFGGSVVAQILQGVDNTKIKQFKLGTLSTYGIMKDTTQVRIRQVTKFLSEQGYIVEGEFQTLTLSRKSATVLSGKEKVIMRLPKETKKEFAVKRQNGKAMVGFDTALFERLRKVRSEIAQSISMPAYIVFTDTSLRDMCVKLPKNESALLDVSGVGKAKQEKYGRFFIAEIQKYLAENPNPQGEKLLDLPDLSGANSDRKLMKFLAENKERLESRNEEFTLSQFCDEMLLQLGLSADKQAIRKAIQKWLVDENYLSEQVCDGRKNVCTTILSEEAGICEVEKISSINRPYLSIVYPKTAQDFILSNIDEIAENV